MIQKDASGSWAQIIIVSSIIEADPKKKKTNINRKKYQDRLSNSE